MNVMISEEYSISKTINELLYVIENIDNISAFRCLTQESERDFLKSETFLQVYAKLILVVRVLYC